MRSTFEVGTAQRCLAALLSAVLASGSLTPTLAFAQERKAAATKPAKGAKADEEAKRAAARQHYTEAEEKLKAGDFAGALEKYKAANDVLPAPVTMYKMALCLDKLDKSAEAIAAYEAFLSANPPGASAERVAEVEARLPELKKKLPVVVALRSEPAGAEVAVDGAKQPGVTPIELKLLPGHHTLRVSLSGHEPAEKELTIEPGASQALAVTLVPSQPAEVAQAEAPAETAPILAEASPSSDSNIVPYALLGIAGAGVVVGSVFGVMAMQSKSDFDKGDRSASKADAVDRNALVADMAFGAALTFGVTGLVLLLTDDSGSEKAAAKAGALRVAPYVSPEGAGAGAFMKF